MYRLDTSGARLGELRVVSRADAIEVLLAARNRAMHYEIVRR